MIDPLRYLVGLDNLAGGGTQLRVAHSSRDALAAPLVDAAAIEAAGLDAAVDAASIRAWPERCTNELRAALDADAVTTEAALLAAFASWVLNTKDAATTHKKNNGGAREEGDDDGMPLDDPHLEDSAADDDAEGHPKKRPHRRAAPNFEPQAWPTAWRAPTRTTASQAGTTTKVYRSTPAIRASIDYSRFAHIGDDESD